VVYKEISMLNFILAKARSYINISVSTEEVKYIEKKLVERKFGIKILDLPEGKKYRNKGVINHKEYMDRLNRLVKDVLENHEDEDEEKKNEKSEKIIAEYYGLVLNFYESFLKNYNQEHFFEDINLRFEEAIAKCETQELSNLSTDEDKDLIVKKVKNKITFKLISKKINYILWFAGIVFIIFPAFLYLNAICSILITAAGIKDIYSSVISFRAKISNNVFDEALTKKLNKKIYEKSAPVNCSKNLFKTSRIYQIKLYKKLAIVRELLKNLEKIPVIYPKYFNLQGGKCELRAVEPTYSR
jgi:hypothetical protein